MKKLDVHKVRRHRKIKWVVSMIDYDWKYITWRHEPKTLKAAKKLARSLLIRFPLVKYVELYKCEQIHVYDPSGELDGTWWSDNVVQRLIMTPNAKNRQLYTIKSQVPKKRNR